MERPPTPSLLAAASQPAAAVPETAAADEPAADPDDRAADGRDGAWPALLLGIALLLLFCVALTLVAAGRAAG